MSGYSVILQQGDTADKKSGFCSYRSITCSVNLFYIYIDGSNTFFNS